MHHCKAQLISVLAVLHFTVSAAVSCSEGCTSRGNCNADDGTCQCAWGWTGPACDVPLLPACQTNSTARPWHGTSYAKNCECYKQLFKFFNCHVHSKCEQMLMAARYGSGVNCYTYKDVPAEQQRSVFPELNDTSVSWHVLSHTHSGDTVLRPLPPENYGQGVNLWNTPVFGLPMHHCPERCNDNGFCIDVDKASQCRCHKGWSGPLCKDVDMALCPNKCLGRGACIAGFCHCTPPYWGLDCGREKAVVPNPNAIPPRARLSIYVYELPHWLSSPLELDDDLPDNSPTYTAYTWFHEQLLRDSAVRTFDPYEANLFYVPAHVYSYASNVGDPNPHAQRVLKYVADTWPFFNRTQGKDHIIWVQGDRGACYISGNHSDHVIKITHFGYHTHPHMNESRMYMHPRPHHHHLGCHLPLRDVVAPPLVRVDRGVGGVRELYDKVVAAGGVDPQRKTLFFFAGGVREHDRIYSGGARQAVARLVKQLKEENSAPDVVFIEGHVHNFVQLHRESIFCLAPHGAGFGMRFTIAMVHGCIPVTISDLVLQPFEPMLPYHEFSLRVPLEQIPDLVQILRTVTPEEQARLRMGMAKHYRAFVWQPDHEGLAYNTTLENLHHTLQHLWGNLYRRKRHRARLA